MEELLKIARERYPIGTKFIACNTKQKCVIASGLFKEDSIEGYINEVDSVDRFVSTDGLYHCILSGDIWAEIISTPEVVEKDFFEEATNSICKKPYSLNVVWEDKIVETIINRFIQRSELGIKKYNTTLDQNKLPLKEWLQHSIEEKMDDILYMQRALNELTN